MANRHRTPSVAELLRERPGERLQMVKFQANLGLHSLSKRQNDYSLP